MSSSDFWVGPPAAPDTYRLVSLLGGGGEGEVWEAVLPLSTDGRRSVAVKIMRSMGGGDELQRWDRFGHLLRSLSHPGLVRVTDVFAGPAMHREGDLPPGRCLYVVMDHIEGTTLREWAVDHPDTTASHRLRMLRMVASALDEMHSGATTEVPVAHGDVKPANIVVRPDGGAVLVDLGLARLTDSTGVMGRSAPYAAPELRIPGAMATPEADRFAFAVSVAQALTAQPPPLGPDGWLDVTALETLLRTHPMTARRHMLVREILAVVTAPVGVRPRQLRPWLDGAVDTLSQVTTDGELATAAQGDTAATTPLTAYRPPAPAYGAPPTQIGQVQPALGTPPKRRRRGPVIAAIAAVVAVLAAAGAIGLGSLGAFSGGAVSNAATPTTAPAAQLAVATATSTAPTTDPTVEPTTADATASVPSDTAHPVAPVGSGAITYLPDLDPIRGYWSSSTTLAIDGTNYTHTLLDTSCNQDEPRTREYDLGRAYTSFTTVVGMSDDTDSGAVSQAEFFVDGISKGKFSIQRGGVQKVSLPVTGALTFKVIVSTITPARCTNGRPGLALGDPKLTS